MMKKNTPPKRRVTPVVNTPKPSLFSPKRPVLWLLVTVVTAVVVLGVLFLPRKVEVPAALDECVVSVLRQVHKSSHTEGKYPAVTYTALATKAKGDTVTLYGVMMYREYTCTVDDQLETWGEGHDPFAITATKNADGTYTATDCWWPKNGADHIPSIRKQFPSYCQRKAVRYRTFYAAHAAACDEAARQNIADVEKYVVMESESENVRLAYCVKTGTSYINFSAGYASDGTCTFTENTAVFGYGNRTLTFAVDGDTWVYREAESKNIPAVWKTIGDVTYLADGVRFVPDDGDDVPAVKVETAPIGPTVTVAAHTWADEATLREMFGQHVPSSYRFDTADNRYLPVRPIEDRGQLERFIAAFGDAWSGLTLENFAQYDDAFFEDHYLMMTYFRDGMAGCDPKVSSYTYVREDATLWLSVRLLVEKPAVGDAVVGQWLLFSGIAKEDFKKANALEAYVERTLTKEEANTSFTGVVKQVEGRSVLLEDTNVSQFSSGVWVELGEIELDPKVGEFYAVTYDGIVMPSMPPRIIATTIQLKG